MIKGQRYTYTRMVQDISKEKYPYTFYYSGNNIRIIETTDQSKYSVTNERGNELSVDLPNPIINTANNTITAGTQIINYFSSEIEQQISNNLLPSISNTQKIFGNTVTRNSIILFSTDSNGFDCIWRVRELLEGDFNLELIYCRNLNFSVNSPIQAIFNYENERIQKVYWVDGINQLRFINLEQSIENEDSVNLIDVNSNTLNTVGNFDLTQPIIDGVLGGGNHTAGMIQYTYTLYRVNGSETTISPLSELIPLDRGDTFGGGELNEIVGSSPIVQINNIDNQYDNIRIYAVKYTTFNVIPTISLIVDQEIPANKRVRYTDGGNTIRNLTLAEFLFLGGNPIIPNHIQAKDNRLFAFNLREATFNFEIDTRAYMFRPNASSTTVLSNVSVNTNGQTTGISRTISSNFNNAEEHDSITPNFEQNAFQFNSIVRGGTGKYIEFELLQLSGSEIRNQSGRNIVDLRFLKDEEFYRFGIQFYNNLGQTNFPSWIVDVKTPRGTGGKAALEDIYNCIRITLKPEFYIEVSNRNLSPIETPVGYKILRAERTVADRTIIAQGMLSGMMVQTTEDVRNFNFWINEQNRSEASLNLVKIPVLFQREFETKVPLLTEHLAHINETGFGEGGDEIYRDQSRDEKRQQSWLYSKMMQLYSPDISFNESLQLSSNMKLRIIGGVRNLERNIWSRVRSSDNLNIIYDNKAVNVPDYINSGGTPSQAGFWRGYGLMGPGFEQGEIRFTQVALKYGNFVGLGQRTYDIYGTPEVTERGQGVTRYNNDNEFAYTNSFTNVISDVQGFSNNNPRDDTGPISSVNSYGARCITLVEGADNTSERNRKTLQQMRDSVLSSTNTNVALIAELIKPESEYYSGNIYGGISYEAKLRTSYIEIGEYTEISNNSVTIYNAGDTFVNTFRFHRVTRTDTEVLDPNTYNLTEVIEYPCETYIDIKNRSDISIQEWDGLFQPSFNEAFNYNNVYSQQSNLVRSQGPGFNFRRVEQFDTRIQASRIKIPGEDIDSWTDFLANEIMDLDGKYGPINAVISFKDNIYTLQDTGVAFISINPRIQIPGADGIEVQLGTGQVLDDYNYVSTTSGTVNKWSVFESPTGFYYFDAFNKALCKFPNNLDNHLSDAFGMHSFFTNNIDYNIVKDNNPFLKRGITGIYNLATDDAYLTVHQGDNSFTIAFNERAQGFTSFYDYKPSLYVVRGFRMLTTHPDNNKLYTHFENKNGDLNNFGEFYGIRYPSSVTYHVNTQEQTDCIFNNIEYKHEVYNNNIDIPNETLNSVRVYNEYMNTGTIPLILNSNLKRKFRIWRANLPRIPGSRDRVRGQWCFVKVNFDNTNNRKMILHDMTVYYTVYR